MPRSRAQRSAATKKAWVTRRRKGFRKKVKRYNEDPDYANKTHAKIAGATVGGLAINAHRNQTKFQHEWVRGNGEIIHTRGFKGKSYKNLEKATSSIDKSLRKHHKIAHDDGLVIRNRHPFIIPNKHLGGLSRPAIDSKAAKNAREQGVKAVEEAYKSAGKTLSDKEKDQVRKGIRGMHRVMGLGKKNKIHINPNLAKTEDGASVLVHEIAHRIDHDEKFSGTKKFRRAAGHKHNAKAATGNSAFAESKSGAGHTPKFRGIKGTYQGGSPSEDFAETFRRSQGMKDIGESPNLRSVYDTRRKKYMQGKIIDPRGKDVAGGHLRKKEGLHNHYDKFLVGGVIAGAGAYGYHKHRQRMKRDHEYAAAHRRRRARAIPGRRFDAPGSVTRAAKRKISRR